MPTSPRRQDRRFCAFHTLPGSIGDFVNGNDNSGMRSVVFATANADFASLVNRRSEVQEYFVYVSPDLLNFRSDKPKANG